MPVESQVQKVTNLEAATRQLSAAIRMFFAEEDAVAVHTLACAAREIYEKHCCRQGRGRMFDIVKEANPAYTEKELWHVLNGPRNFFKHPSETTADEIEFSDLLNDFMLVAACNDCATLCGPNKTVEIEAFMTWFLTVHEYDEGTPSPDPRELSQLNDAMRALDKRFPGLRTAPRTEQKRFGTPTIDSSSWGLAVIMSNWTIST